MRTRLVIASQRVRPEVAGPMTSSAKQSSQRLITWIASSLSLLAMTHQSKLHAVRAFEPEQLPRFVRRRDLVAEVLDDATDLGDLLGIAFGELAGTNVKRILQAHSHIAADQLQKYRRLEQAAVDAMGEIVQVSGVVAFMLEFDAMAFAERLVDLLDIAKRIRKNIGIGIFRSEEHTS